VELRTGLEQRLVALRAEASAGRQRLAQVQAEKDRLLGVLARLDTAVRILAEEVECSAPDGPPV
jgi:hypothetical protein